MYMSQANASHLVFNVRNFTCRMCAATKLKHDPSRGCCRCRGTDVRAFTVNPMELTNLRMQDLNVIWKRRTLHLTYKITMFMLIGEDWGVQKRTQRGWLSVQKAFFAVGRQLTAVQLHWALFHRDDWNKVFWNFWHTRTQVLNDLILYNDRRLLDTTAAIHFADQRLSRLSPWKEM